MRIEWPTLGLIIGCYAVWLLALFWLPGISVALAFAVMVPVIALQSSLQHEVLHGHPFDNRPLSEALVHPSLNLAIPYLRFRDTHLAHHKDATLTDPYDDPESNYLDPAVWARLPRWKRALRVFNNTLAGRMLVGPALGQVSFMVADWRLIRGDDRRVAQSVARAWALHIGTSAGLVALLAASPMPVWVYLIACYLGLSILKIRTFLEHQAHERAGGRTVVVEGRGVLSFLFLNNNLHVVHHMHPRVPWYRLPALYLSNTERYLGCNGGYRYTGYGQVFRRHLWRGKDPVAHPLYRADQGLAKARSAPK